MAAGPRLLLRVTIQLTADNFFSAEMGGDGKVPGLLVWLQIPSDNRQQSLNLLGNFC